MAKSTAKHRAYVEAAQKKLMGGDVPIVVETDYQRTLMAAFNYYNRNYENKFLSKAVYAYVKKNYNSYYPIISKVVPDWELSIIGKMVCVINDKGFLSEKDLDRLKSMIESVYIKYKDKKIEEDIPEQVVKNVISIDARITELARAQSEQIDYAIDEWFNNHKSNFSTKAHLAANNISGAVAKRISEYYKSTVSELDEAIAGTDEQLVEGYSFLTKSELKRFRDFVQSIIDDCAQHQVIVKKPRAIKVKPPGVLVKRLKYMFEYPDLNLKSVNPSSIIGADELWVYNTKTRKLINYTALSGEVLSVKGTTIINYDVAKSESVTLRKPEEFFKTLGTAGKRAMNNAAKLIKTKPSKPNGRINADMILLNTYL